MHDNKLKIGSNDDTLLSRIEMERDNMQDWIKWVFDGIGTEVISGIIGLLIGGIGGFVIGRHTTSKQTQKAGDSTKQKQSFVIDNGREANSKRTQETNMIVQKQKAGNNSEQIQTGRVKNEQ